MAKVNLSLEAQRKISEFTRVERALAFDQLKIPEIIPGCEVTNVDPHGVGLATIPRMFEVRVNEFIELVRWNGYPVLHTGEFCTVVRQRGGNTYQIAGASGAGGSATPTDAYLFFWVYDVSENTMVYFDTINAALAYGLLTSGDYVLIPPGIHDVTFTLVDGVIITEQIPGTVILHYTGGPTCVTCADGGYLQVKEIQCTRGAGSNAVAVDASGLGVGESCEIRAELAKATQTGATGAEVLHTIQGGGSGTLTVYANRIEADFTSSGGGNENGAVYVEDDTFYIFSDIFNVFAGAVIWFTYGVRMNGSGSCRLRGHIDANGDEWCHGVTIASNTIFEMWGDISVSSANGAAMGAEASGGIAIIYGNLSAIGSDTGYGAYTNGGTLSVYGNCYGEETSGAGDGVGAYTDSGTLRVHGDATGVDAGGNSNGARCVGGVLTLTGGRASGGTFDLERAAGTMQVSMVEFDTYSGTITSYYPLPGTGYIGEAGGVTGRLAFDFTGGTDFANFASCHVGINEVAPGAMQQITIDGVTVKGLIIKGAVAQIANLQEWQDSNGANLVEINSVGWLGVGVNPVVKTHIYLSDAGADPAWNVAVDAVIFEAAGNINTQYFCPANRDGLIGFSRPGQRNAGVIQYSHSADGSTDYMAFWVDFPNNPSEIARFDASGYFGIGEINPDRRLHVTEADAVTAAISYVTRKTHSTSGAAAALFGVGEEHELEDAIGANHVASEVVTLWADPQNTLESPLRRWTTYPQGSAGPGYCGFWTWDTLDNVAKTVIPNGAGDVTVAITIHYTVAESGGGYSGSIVVIPNNSSANIYDDATDIFTVTVAADGSVTIARSAGATTAKIALFMVWI